jgi:hypothetical protein
MLLYNQNNNTLLFKTLLNFFNLLNDPEILIIILILIHCKINNKINIFSITLRTTEHIFL